MSAFNRPFAFANWVHDMSQSFAIGVAHGESSCSAVRLPRRRGHTIAGEKFTILGVSFAMRRVPRFSTTLWPAHQQVRCHRLDGHFSSVSPAGHAHFDFIVIAHCW
jgi:hypothetical protein